MSDEKKAQAFSALRQAMESDRFEDYQALEARIAILEQHAQAMAILERRGWCVAKGKLGWIINEIGAFPSGWHPTPTEAILAAEKWLREREAVN